MAEQTQDGQKTIVSFVAGLLIGGLLVWAFSGPAITETPTETAEETATETTEETPAETGAEITAPVTDTPADAPAQPVSLPVGEGRIEVANQPASASIALTAATYPIAEGWVGVREYTDGRLGSILGVVRFSEAQGIVPANIILQRSTTAGRQYAVVIFSENGDREFNLANDVQIDQIFATFTAQ